MRYLAALFVVASMCFGQDYRLLVSGSDIGSYDPISGQFLGILINYDDGSQIFPTRILRSPYQTIIVFDSNGRINEYTSDGQFLRQFPVGPNDVPPNQEYYIGGCFTPSGTMIITNYYSVTERDYATGNVIRFIYQNTYLADAQFGPNGNLFITRTSGAVYEYSYPAGQMLSNWGFSGYPTEISMSQTGKLLVLDSSNNYPRIMAREENGWSIFFDAQSLSSVKGMAKHPVTGNIFLMSNTFGTIYEISGQDGSFLNFIIASPEITNYQRLAFSSEECNSIIPGDINSDNSVDINDLAILLAHFGETCP